MTSPLARVDLESDVTRGVVTGLAFLVALALNLDPQRRWLAVAVFGGGALAFFGLAFLASKDESYGVPQLRWYLFAAWGVLLLGVGLSTESTVGVALGAVIAVYAAVRAWLFDALADGGEDEEDADAYGREGEKAGDSDGGESERAEDPDGGEGDEDAVESRERGDEPAPDDASDWSNEDADDEWTGDALPPHLRPDDGDDSPR